MSSFNVPITQISNIVPIEGADAIELAQVFGYQSVVKKGQFKVGDYVVYIPEASIVPHWILEKLNLVGRLAGPQSNRVKAIKLRGVISQGLLLPVITDYPHGLPYGVCAVEDQFEHPMFCVNGQDVAEHLGITKYEPPIPIAMAGEVCNLFGRTLGYDIENFQRYPNVFQATDEIYLTEKLHGTFCCIAYIPGLNHPELLDGDFFAYSKGLGAQGLVFKHNDNNVNNIYQRVLIEHQAQLRELGGNVFVMGEIFGKGIQDLTYGLDKPQFRVFDIYTGLPQQGRFESFNALKLLCDGLFELVPAIYEGPFSEDIIKQYRDGQTLVGGTNIREGVVIRLINEIRRSPEIGRVILKAISPAYLTRKDGTEYT